MNAAFAGEFQRRPETEHSFTNPETDPEPEPESAPEPERLGHK
jgi:hypothetical protein